MTKAGVMIDIGCEKFGLLARDPNNDVFRLENEERLEGLTIDRIDLDEGRIDLSLAGLSDLVAGRPEQQPKRTARAEQGPAVSAEAKAKEGAAVPEKASEEKAATKKKKKKEEAKREATQNLVLDGADLLQSTEGGSLTLELTGGLAIKSVDMARGTITLTLDGAGSEGGAAATNATAAAKKKKKKKKRKKKANASVVAGEAEQDGPA